MPVLVLAFVFFTIALVYATVGFGGGSSYSALLVLAGKEFHLIPVISLSCNIIVVSGGAFHFHKAGLFSSRKLLPFLVLSIPMAWFGGQLQVNESTFVGLLGMILLLAGGQMIWTSLGEQSLLRSRAMNLWILGLPAGAVIGLISGIVGIGGGIFLAPLLHLGTSLEARKIAAMASGFILLNSISGLAGQLMKQGEVSVYGQWVDSWPLFLAVFLGGQLGSRLGINVLPEHWIKRLTGLLIAYVAIRLLLKWVSM
ncbi:MAG: putative membrane protein YfcA [Lysobacterales bacterium]|jgi:uncharacterized membrane protein YfcA